MHAHWPAPARVRTLITTRSGGISRAPYTGLNVGDHVGDAAAAVAHNRAVVAQAAAKPLAYLQQTHSTIVVSATEALAALQAGSPLNADASVDHSGGAACAVMTADCLPVLFCDRRGTAVAAAHAGWRGLADGILQQTVAAMAVPPQEILAYLGPAIGPGAFEVGAEVRDAFTRLLPQARLAFASAARSGKYRADIYTLARQALAQAGVRAVYGGGRCTVSEADTFFSYRRDGQTGRMVSAVWLD
ncbi:YfiH family protein [Neisseria sp. HSC-16F19]|nr:YfiH family protein [Neisseria sp. HSC-16F19]